LNPLAGEVSEYSVSTFGKQFHFFTFNQRHLRNPMKQSRVKRLAFFFFSFFYSTLYALLAQSCMLAGPAAEREWAIKKLVAVWPPQPDSTQRSITAGFNSGRLPILLFVLADFRRHIKLHTAESSYSQRRGT
jgi:hypothetical protein